MEIVDALIVTLGLDKSNFDRGQKDAQATIKATQDTAQKAGDNSKKLSADELKRLADEQKAKKSADADEQKRQQLAIKRQKEIDDSFKRVGETLGKVSGAAAGLMLVFTGGRGLTSFTQQVVAANDATGMLAKNLGVAPESLSAWEKAVASAGGKAEDARGAMAALADTFESLKHFQVPANAGILQALGIGAGDLEHADTALEKIREKLLAYQKGHSRQDTAWMAGQLGLNPAMTNLLLDPQFTSKMAAARATGATKPDTDAAREWNRSTAEAQNALSKAVSQLFTRVQPALTHFVDGITHWITDLTKPGNELKLDVAAGAVAAFTLGLGVITKRLLAWSVSGILSKAPAVVEDLAPKIVPPLVADAAGTTLLGRILGMVAGVGGGAAIGMVSNSAPTNVGEADVLARMRQEGKIPARGPETDLPEGLVHKSAYSPNGNTDSQIDHFWDKFGNGLIDWLERSPNHGGGSGGGMPGIMNANYTVPAGGSAFGGGYTPRAPVSGMGGPVFALPPPGPGMAGQEGYLSALEGKHGLPAGLLDNIWAAESGRGRNRGPSRTGAMGDFQFMPGTAKQYGVDTSSFSSSATGAANYFARLLKLFRGDHRKAIAGYNWGEGNVQRDVRTWGNAWDQHLPAETSKYLSRVTGGMSNASRYAGRGGAGGGGVTIGEVHVHTKATDAKGIARDVKGELQAHMRMVGQANTGLS
ncbi:MAG: transglycosylase SLT domain-containing protein [Janthinobacterium lividum]